MSSSQDFTSELALSRHLDAIPFIPAKPGEEFNILNVMIIDTQAKYDRMGESFLPTDASYLDEDYINQEDHGFLEKLKKQTLESMDYHNYGAVINKVFKLGASVSGEGEIEFEGKVNGALRLLGCKTSNCGVPGLDDFFKRNVENVCQESTIKSFLKRDRRQPNSRRVLLAVVTESISGLFEHSATVKESGSQGNAKLDLPTTPMIRNGTSDGNHDETQLVSQRGVIGIVIAIMMLELSPATQTVKVMRHVPFIRRVDNKEYDMAVSWQKMPPFLKRSSRRQTEGFSFVLGETAGFGSDIFASFRAAQEFAEPYAPGEVIREGDYGHAILRGEPLYSPQHVLPGGVIHSEGSMNFLYKAELPELEDIYHKVRHGVDVSVWGYKITSITPAVPFDDAEFVPIHYTRTGEEDNMKLPGALLRYEGDVQVLVPIDPLQDGTNSMAAITTKTSGWEVRESIMYVDVHDSEWKEELERAGYHHLADSEANMDDVKHLGLENKQFTVMGRHELVDVLKPDHDDEGYTLSREYPWRRSGMAI